MAKRYVRKCSISLAIRVMQIKTTTTHLLEWLVSIRKLITSVGEVMEKKEPSFTAGGKLVQPLWKTLWKFLKKLRGVTTWPIKPSSGYIPPKFENIHGCSSVHGSIIHSGQDLETCPSIDGWIKMYTHTYTHILHTHIHNVYNMYIIHIYTLCIIHKQIYMCVCICMHT